MKWTYIFMRIIATPGPTHEPPYVREALSAETSNPDLDPEFMTKYIDARNMIGEMIGTRGDNVVIWMGEAMSGLEAAVANLVKPGEEVISLSNGVFGDYFSELVRRYGGRPRLIRWDVRHPVDPDELQEALNESEASIVTMVHCETPSGVLNPLREVADAVKRSGKLFVVDAVSSIGAVNIDMKWGIDVLIGGSQKALNVPAGLTIMAISDEAWRRIEDRKYEGFYLNLLNWRNLESGFPYTHSEPLLNALIASLRHIMREGLDEVYKRHIDIRNRVIRAVNAYGLTLVPASMEWASPSVSAFYLPTGINDGLLRESMWRKYGVMIGGSLGELSGKVIRIGHMGYTATLEFMLPTVTALGMALMDFGLSINLNNAMDAFMGGSKS
jgi:alanine-glyoxylate transaminase/serine-glyoxylate transaminase/serine-pyruvate transaminase